ncbi:cuticle protein 21-like [Lutzomyia longipalpis]|uniref:cuticle protein 21-like n=1 Tax=Lutzomyia longipalpis TaxID=7200 RepID=UPI0024837EF5|nr:cuticle protein 21-like [Lutzomyia longipalpis]
MISKFVPVFAFLAVAHCRPGLQQVYQAPALLKAAPAAIIQPAPLFTEPALLARKEIYAYDANPQYNFAYDVKDTLTGDYKSQQEILEGGVVKGQYSLLEADGRQRIVNYYADPINGFNADVKYAGAAIAAPQPALVKTIAAPAILKTSYAPAYAAPAAIAAPALIKTAPAAISAPALAPALIKTAPALAPTLIKAAPAISYAQTLTPALTTYTKTLAPALAPAYAPALAPALTTYTKTLAPAYATALPYTATSIVKY